MPSRSVYNCGIPQSCRRFIVAGSLKYSITQNSRVRRWGAGRHFVCETICRSAIPNEVLRRIDTLHKQVVDKDALRRFRALPGKRARSGRPRHEAAPCRAKHQIESARFRLNRLNRNSSRCACFWRIASVGVEKPIGMSSLSARERLLVQRSTSGSLNVSQWPGHRSEPVEDDRQVADVIALVDHPAPLV